MYYSNGIVISSINKTLPLLPIPLNPQHFLPLHKGQKTFGSLRVFCHSASLGWTPPDPRLGRSRGLSTDRAKTKSTSVLARSAPTLAPCHPSLRLRSTLSARVAVICSAAREVKNKSQPPGGTGVFQCYLGTQAKPTPRTISFRPALTLSLRLSNPDTAKHFLPISKQWRVSIPIRSTTSF